MAFGNEIKFKIGGDASSLERTFDRAARRGTQAMDKVDQAVKRTFSPAAMRLRETLDKAREKRLYNEASTVGKIAIVTRELQDYAYARSQSQKNSVAYLRAQLAIEERLTRLRGLQQQQQSANAGGTSMAQQTAGGGGGGAFGSIKGAVQSLALGAAYGVVNAITRYFERGATRAQQSQDVTGSNAGSNIGTAAIIGGLRGQQTAQESELVGIAREIEITQRAIEDLTGGLFGKSQDLLNPMYGDQVDKLRADLTELLKKQTQIRNQNQLTTRELKQQEGSYSNQRFSIEAVNRAREKGVATQVRLAEIERKAAEAEVFNQSRNGTPESQRAAQLRLTQAQGNENAARQSAQQQRLDLVRTFTEDAATGRTFANGRQRPRSETERLAERAAMFRDRARSLALTGGGGTQDANPVSDYDRRNAHLWDGRTKLKTPKMSGVASSILSARKDEGAVASRLSRATSAVPTPDVADPSGVRAELVNTNVILKSIDNSLKNTDTSVTIKRR